MDEKKATAIAFFNYSHTYASSALALNRCKVEATHRDAPVRFLYHHAIEMYLKSFLLAQGFDVDSLKDEFGHNVRKLADGAVKQGLTLIDADIQVVVQMSRSDNVITSRYVRLGIHWLLPIDVLHETCCRLHADIGPKVYAGSGVTRIPVLDPGPLNRLMALHVDNESSGQVGD